MGIAIEARDIIKEFPVKKKTGNRAKDFLFPRFARLRALDSVSLDVQEGEILGLLGPNGAGKTTLIKCLCGLLTTTQGRVRVRKNSPQAMSSEIGVMLGSDLIYYRLTGYDNLKFFAQLYDVEDYDARIKELAGFFGIEDKLDSFVESYSSGMKSKLALARALIHDPKIVFLDEPTIGLDPQIALEVRKKIKEMGKTVLLATHHLGEAEEVCDRIAIISNGQIAVVETLSKLRKLVGKKVILGVSLARANERLVQRLKRMPAVRGVSCSHNNLRIIVDSKSNLPEIFSLLSDYKVTKINEFEPTLLDVFLKVTGE